MRCIFSPKALSVEQALCATVILIVYAISIRGVSAQYEAPLEPLGKVIDLEIGEKVSVELHDGSTADIEVIKLEEQRDVVRSAVRHATVTVNVNGKTGQLVSANYHLPRELGDVQIDCPVTRGYIDQSSKANIWGLEKAVRLRVWPADSPWIRPDTFLYPVRQRWFATQTQMANEPTYVDGGERPTNKSIYYHYGLDIGGAEGQVEVVAATDGLVVSARGELLDGHPNDSPVKPREDVVYLLDARGWYYRYSHLYEIDESVQVGQKVKLGARIGLIGKEGASGGWSHLHFGIDSRQPSGQWGAVEGYAFLWQSYLQEHQPRVVAVARPHQLARVGDQVVLDGSKSWVSTGRVASYTWMLGERRQIGPRLKRTYNTPGTYCEVLRVRDRSGNVAFDFAEIQVVDPKEPDRLPPTIHPVYYPTQGIRAGDRITFKVRSFRTGSRPVEVWDFGDGTAKVEVSSDGNEVTHAKDGYAVTPHRFTRPGDYLVSVVTTNDDGYQATGRLHVRVAPAIN